MLPRLYLLAGSLLVFGYAASEIENPSANTSQPRATGTFLFPMFVSFSCMIP